MENDLGVYNGNESVLRISDLTSCLAFNQQTAFCSSGAIAMGVERSQIRASNEIRLDDVEGTETTPLCADVTVTTVTAASDDVSVPCAGYMRKLLLAHTQWFLCIHTYLHRS